MSNCDAFGRVIHTSRARVTDASAAAIEQGDLLSWMRTDDQIDPEIMFPLAIAARQKVEDDSGWLIGAQTWRVTFDGAPARSEPLVLPLYPVTAITSITSYDGDGASAVLDAASYRLDGDSAPSRVCVQPGYTWPSSLRETQGIVVVCAAGFAMSAVPEPLLMAIRLLAAHWYVNRETVVIGTSTLPIQHSYDSIIGAHRLGLLS